MLFCSSGTLPAPLFPHFDSFFTPVKHVTRECNVDCDWSVQLEQTLQEFSASILPVQNCIYFFFWIWTHFDWCNFKNRIILALVIGQWGMETWLGPFKCFSLEIDDGVEMRRNYCKNKIVDKEWPMCLWFKWTAFQRLTCLIRTLSVCCDKSMMSDSYWNFAVQKFRLVNQSGMNLEQSLTLWNFRDNLTRIEIVAQALCFVSPFLWKWYLEYEGLPLLFLGCSRGKFLTVFHLLMFSA